VAWDTPTVSLTEVVSEWWGVFVRSELFVSPFILCHLPCVLGVATQRVLFTWCEFLFSFLEPRYMLHAPYGLILSHILDVYSLNLISFA